MRTRSPGPISPSVVSSRTPDSLPTIHSFKEVFVSWKSGLSIFGTIVAVAATPSSQADLAGRSPAINWALSSMERVAMKLLRMASGVLWLAEPTDAPAGLQESAQPWLQQECRGNTESWDRGRNLGRDFLHGAGNSTRMPEIPPNAAERGLSIIPKGWLSGTQANSRGAPGLRPIDHQGHWPFQIACNFLLKSL